MFINLKKNVSKAKRRLSRQLQLVWRKAFYDRRLVYVWVEKAPGFRGSSEPLDIRKYERLDELDASVLSQAKEWLGDTALSTLEKEFGRSGTLYLAFIHDELVGHQWTLRGRALSSYYLNLHDDDVVFYGAGVHPGYLGRRISPTMKLQIIRQDLDDDNDIFVDVMVWNEANIRALEKLGFRKVVEVPAKTSLDLELLRQIRK